MVLSGTLREFILADVFQLLAQQKITGKLILNNGRNEGIVVFWNGTIVAAEKEDEKFTAKLFNYLIYSKQIPSIKVRELFASFEGDLAGLSSEILNRGLMSKQQMTSFAESVIEDVACSLFLWKAGTYRFNSMRSVDSLIPAGISIPVENIIMEAMRRIDEWHRMMEFITEETIFVRSQRKDDQRKGVSDPIQNPADYIYTCIDGTSPVKEFVKSSCLTEYKIYEALYYLVQHQKILPLSDRISQSVQAALQKKEREKSTTSFSTLFSVLAVIGIILVVVLVVWILFKGVLFPETTVSAYLNKYELPSSLAEEKVSIAYLQYRTLFGTRPRSAKDLKMSGLINNQDLYYYSVKSRFDSEDTGVYNEGKSGNSKKSDYIAEQ